MRAVMRIPSVSMPSEISAPRRDFIASGSAPRGESESWPTEIEALRLVRQAEALGIPWRRVLSREIFAEGMLQRFLGSEVEEMPLWRALSILPNSLFHSWRVRDIVDRLSWEASAQGSQEARREMGTLVDCLSGPRSRQWTDDMARAKHYWFAYHRILELQAAALAAERSALRGEGCVGEVCESAGCVRRDAEWAVARLESPQRTHALDDAVMQAREEGFEIPHAATELQAFSRLRRFVLRHRIFRRKPGRPHGKRGGSRRAVAPDAKPRWVRKGPPPGIGIGKAFLVDPPF